jgi:hypothetical protein
MAYLPFLRARYSTENVMKMFQEHFENELRTSFLRKPRS